MHLMTPTTQKSLYDQLGGQAAVDAAVDILSRKVLSDDRISRFFDDVDMDRQRLKQKAFLTMAFGGPANYSGKDMRTAHARFDAVVELLGGTLKELGVSDELIGQVAAIAESTRKDVLRR